MFAILLKEDRCRPDKPCATGVALSFAATPQDEKAKKWIAAAGAARFFFLYTAQAGGLRTIMSQPDAMIPNKFSLMPGSITRFFLLLIVVLLVTMGVMVQSA
ncbi:phosphotransferase RcsD, partial [Cronobacter dublinensis subsp. dublinensis]|nr:phosphotransferase RcsD [Cronobacter dublinensis subsp. dublinensis]